MTKNILVMDELSDRCSQYLLAYDIERVLQYTAYFSISPDRARESLKERDYAAAIVEPYSMLADGKDSPSVQFIRELREKGIPVMIFTDQLLYFMDRKYDLVQGRDYQKFILKEADIIKEFCPAIRRLAERK